MIEFEWDEQENSSNQRKHSLSFEEAARVFLIYSICVNKINIKMVKSGGKRLVR